MFIISNQGIIPQIIPSVIPGVIPGVIPPIIQPPPPQNFSIDITLDNVDNINKDYIKANMSDFHSIFVAILEVIKHIAQGGTITTAGVMTVPISPFTLRTPPYISTTDVFNCRIGIFDVLGNRGLIAMLNNFCKSRNTFGCTRYIFTNNYIEDIIHKFIHNPSLLTELLRFSNYQISIVEKKQIPQLTPLLIQSPTGLPLIPPPLGIPPGLPFGFPFPLIGGDKNEQCIVMLKKKNDNILDLDSILYSLRYDKSKIDIEDKKNIYYIQWLEKREKYINILKMLSDKKDNSSELSDMILDIFDNIDAITLPLYNYIMYKKFYPIFKKKYIKK